MRARRIRVRIRSLLVACSVALGAAAAPGPADALDRDLYDGLLERHTRTVSDVAGVRVDYAALRADPEWRRLVGTLEATDPEALVTHAERLAFWIDAYNILAIDWVVRRGPVESIRDLGSLLRPIWKRTAGRIGGREVTLDEIEHRILRPMGEARIHAAIVCASTSCPSLRREAFRPGILGMQLDEQVRSFLADPRKGLALEPARGRVRVSKIFDWFADDFGGAEGVVAFVTRHAPEDARAWLAENAEAGDLVYFDYDWSLNALEGRR